jgi:hypothetical protein
MIEICRESQNEARQRPVYGKHEHGQARWEENPSSAKGKQVVIGEERPPRMMKPKILKDDQWQNNERGKPQQRLKATIDILMSKNNEGTTDIGEHENQTIQNTKLDNPVSVSLASTSATGSSSNK